MNSLFLLALATLFLLNDFLEKIAFYLRQEVCVKRAVTFERLSDVSVHIH